jgi:hypothetical protein
MCSGCGITRRIRFNFSKKIDVVMSAEKPRFFQPFLRVVLEKVVFSAGVFVVKLW